MKQFQFKTTVSSCDKYSKTNLILPHATQCVRDLDVNKKISGVVFFKAVSLLKIWTFKSTLLISKQLCSWPILQNVMAFVDVTVLCSSLFEVMVEIELPLNLTCKNKKNNLLNVITYRCLWKNQRNSVQIKDTLCRSGGLNKKPRYKKMELEKFIVQHILFYHAQICTYAHMHIIT